MNRLSRRFLALATVLALVVLPATGAAANTPEDVGTATTALDLLSLEINGVPVVSDALADLNLGSLLSYASTDTNAERNALGNGQPFALSSLLALGQDFTARSDGENKAGGESAALPNGLGALTVGELSAIVENGEALSVVDALSASLTGVTALTGLGVALPDLGSLSKANASQATAQNGAVLSNVDLNLGDLLGLDLLNNLDLGSLLGLLGDLGLTDLQLSAIVGQLTDSLTEIDTLTNQLSALIGDIGLEGLVATIDGLVAEITGLEAALADITGDTTLEEARELLNSGVCSLPLLAPALCDSLETFNTLEELLSAANLELDQLRALLATVEGLIAQLEDVLGGLLGLVDGLLDTLLGLLDGLVGTDLVSLETLTLGVSSAAGQDAHATALCDAGGVSILGIAAPVNGCDALKGGLSGLPGTLTGLLGNLPIVGGTLDGVVHVGGLDIVEEVGTDGDFQVARAAVTPLELGIDLSNLDLGLGGVDGGLLNVVDGLLGEFDLLEGLLGSGTSSQGVSAQSVQAQNAASLEGLLGTLTGTVGGLLGGDLGALGLPSLELAGPGLESVSNFGAAAGTTTPISTDEPAAPTPTGNLPKTGGGAMGLALALMGTAGALTWWSRGHRSPLAALKGMRG